MSQYSRTPTYFSAFAIHLPLRKRSRAAPYLFRATPLRQATPRPLAPALPVACRTPPPPLRMPQKPAISPNRIVPWIMKPKSSSHSKNPSNTVAT
ncbi:hypothetical protein C8Q76DRAFT_725076 [Earliella scabrosa]|nr:hypothetical protein C8Q76DRAFT_725076 [Earliella scabrosa]